MTTLLGHINTWKHNFVMKNSQRGKAPAEVKDSVMHGRAFIKIFTMVAP